MNRLQGWVRYAAEAAARVSSSSAAAATPTPRGGDDDEGEDFIYARVQVHSDDEQEGTLSRHGTLGSQRRTSAPHPLRGDGSSGGASPPNTSTAPAQQQQQHSQMALHQHSHSDGELLQMATPHGAERAHGPSTHAHGCGVEPLPRLRSKRDDDTACSTWVPDWDAHPGIELQQQQQQQQPSDSLEQVEQRQQQQQQQRVEGTGGSEDDEERDPDYDHSAKRQDLIIYAIPLTRGKVIFLPVCPWRSEPEEAKGWRAAVAGHVGRMQGEAGDMWARMAAAEQGSISHRMYRLGKRMLDGISPEERLMRGVPKDVSRVIIHHPSQVGPEALQAMMSTMTRSYGLQAVGRAAAATVMLPLAVGVDLIILPGPQVLTYYTLWELYRNGSGAVGTTRMARFVTQKGAAQSIRVCYAEEPRLDRFHEAAAASPEGVLSEEDIDALVDALREPDLHEPLLSLRIKALREAGALRSSRGGDEYTSLPEADPVLDASERDVGDRS